MQKDRELQALRSRSIHVWETNRHVHRTLATGLYHRFKNPAESSNPDKASGLYLRSNPYEFAYFVAELLEGIYGGKAYVTLGADETGIDIEHERREGLFLVQVRCSYEDVDTEPVAVLHSQVVRRRAQGGWLVTTGGLTEAARQYAKETDIVWADGIRLVELWSQYLEQLGRSEQEETSPGSGAFRPAVT